MVIINESCAFCKIIRGQEQGYVVFEDETSLAFLDRRPLFPGHYLLAPKDHYQTLTDLSAALIAPLFANAQLLAQAIEQGLAAEGTFVAINNRGECASGAYPHRAASQERWTEGLVKHNSYESETAIVAVQQAIRAAIAQIHELRS